MKSIGLSEDFNHGMRSSPGKKQIVDRGQLRLKKRVHDIPSYRDNSAAIAPARPDHRPAPLRCRSSGAFKVLVRIIPWGCHGVLCRFQIHRVARVIE